MIVPLLPGPRSLIGLLLLGPRMGGFGYSTEEVELIEGLCSLLAIALFNAYLYKQQERKIEELEAALKAK